MERLGGLAVERDGFDEGTVEGLGGLTAVGERYHATPRAGKYEP